MHGVAGDQGAQEEGWVICRVFKKKNLVHHGGGAPRRATTRRQLAAAAMEGSPSNCSTVTVSDHVKAQMLHSSASDDALDHILQYMGRPAASRRPSRRRCRRRRRQRRPRWSSTSVRLSTASS